MLILMRRLGESVTLKVPPSTETQQIVVKVVRLGGQPGNENVRLGFDADNSVDIDRTERETEEQPPGIVPWYQCKQCGERHAPLDWLAIGRTCTCGSQKFTRITA